MMKKDVNSEFKKKKNVEALDNIDNQKLIKKETKKTNEDIFTKKRHINRLYIGYKARLFINIFLFLLSILFCLFFASKTLEREKLTPINYSEKGMVDYKVYLNENNFYEREYLEANKAYVASLIKNIDINFNYSFNIDDITNMDFDYKIIGELVIENNGGTKRYFEKNYTLLDEKKAKLQNNNIINIKENLLIDYDYYNKLANNFRNTYGVDTNSYLNVYLEVKSKTSDTLNYKIEETNRIPLKIPLSERAIEINFDSNNKDVTKYVIPTGKVIFNLKYLILEIIFFIITSVCFVNFIKYLVVSFKQNTKYDKYVNKLLKEYDRLIVETKTSVDMSKYNIIEVKKFTELLDVRDNLKVPILYFNIVKHQKGIFYIKDNDDIYLLTIKNIDLINKKIK